MLPTYLVHPLVVHLPRQLGAQVHKVIQCHTCSQAAKLIHIWLIMGSQPASNHRPPSNEAAWLHRQGCTAPQPLVIKRRGQRCQVRCSAQHAPRSPRMRPWWHTTKPSFSQSSSSGLAAERSVMAAYGS